ncbi:MAG TPA: von Willebrand factor type A domain-containing protein [Chthoniobacterales bacterium]
MNIDDPKLTAYALDELDEAERAATANEIAASPAAQREVQETQTMARLLRKEFAAEAQQLRHRENTDATKAPLSPNLSDIRDDPWFWTRARPLAIAALFAVFAVIGLAIFGGNKLREKEIAQADQRITTIPPRSKAVEAEVEDAQNPIASYAIVQRFINDGLLPPKDSVRIEEMINYFTYNYPRPKPNELFSIDVEVAGCPWADSHRLVRIGFRGREIADPVVKTKNAAQQLDGTPVAIAREVKIQVEFNSSMVTSRRLMGYDKRMLRKDLNNDEIDAGEIAAGDTVTALYEVVPVGGAASPSVPPVDPLKYSVPPENARSKSSEMLTVNLRYKKPESDKSELLERAVVDDGKQFANASADFKFAAAVAEFGMLLRDSEFKGSGTLGAVLQWAQEGKSADTNGYRAGFLELVRKAQVLKRG